MRARGVWLVWGARWTEERGEAGGDEASSADASADARQPTVSFEDGGRHRPCYTQNLDLVNNQPNLVDNKTGAGVVVTLTFGRHDHKLTARVPVSRRLPPTRLKVVSPSPALDPAEPYLKQLGCSRDP